MEQTRVRSFDHRCVQALRQLEPRIEGAVLIAETAARSIRQGSHAAARLRGYTVQIISFWTVNKCIRLMRAEG